MGTSAARRWPRASPATGWPAPASATLRSFDPSAGTDVEVPDPWGQPPAADEHVYELVTAATDGLVGWLVSDGLPAWEGAGGP